MKISDILTENHILFGVRVADKSELINRALDVFKPDMQAAAFETVRGAVFEREKLMSTGVGKGVAIPHAKTGELTGYLTSLAILDQPVDYDAIDGDPVDLLFMLVGPADNRNHIRLLSRVSKMMNKDSFRRSLKECADAAAVLNLFRKEEETGYDL